MAPRIEWATNLLSDNEENIVNKLFNCSYLSSFNFLVFRALNLIKMSDTINNFGRCAIGAIFNLDLPFHRNMICGRLYRKFQGLGMGDWRATPFHTIYPWCWGIFQRQQSHHLF